MSLIDDAWRLAQDIKDVNGGACNHCTDHSGEHRDWCPTLIMPRIVEALEAAGYAEDMLRLLDVAAFRKDHLAVLSLADRVRCALGHARSDDPPVDA